MLMIGDRLNSYTIAAGEPWIMSVQMRRWSNMAVVDWSQRRLVLSFYDGARQKVDEIEGVYTSDASGAYFAFIRDGRFSETLSDKSGITVELAERLLNGRAVVATGGLTTLRSAPNVATFGQVIGRSDCRFTLYFEENGTLRPPEQEILPYLSDVIAPPATLSNLSLSGTLRIGTASNGTIAGATDGSTITDNVAGLSVNSAARTYTYDGTGSAGSIANGLIETHPNATNSPRQSTVTVAAANIALSALSLAAPSVTENAASGTTISGIVGKTAGSTLTLANDDGGRFAISGPNLIAGLTNIDFEAGASRSIVIRETLSGATNSPRDTTLAVGVVNVSEQPSLRALLLSSTSLTIGTAASGTITEAAAGSAITASGLPAGFSINGPARTWAYDGSGPASNSTVTLTETLGDSPNSPRQTQIGVTVAAAPTVAITAATPSRAEGAAGTTFAWVYTVTRSTGSGTVNVAWSFAAGTTSAADWQGGALPAGGSIAFAAGETSKTFSVISAGDGDVEPDETFTVSIAAPSGYAAGSSMSATGTILNDDPAPSDAFGISSAKSYAQPADSTSYQQQKADREGVTFAKRTGGNADLFVLNNGILSLPARPYVANANVFTCPMRATAPNGDIVDYVSTVTVAQVEAPQTLSYFYRGDFTGPAGTSINDLDGWGSFRYAESAGIPQPGKTVDDYFQLHRDGNGKLVPSNQNDAVLQLFDPGNTGEGELKFDITRSDAEDTARFAAVILADTDGKSFLSVFGNWAGGQLFFGIRAWAGDNWAPWPPDNNIGIGWALGQTRNLGFRYLELTKQLQFFVDGDLRKTFDLSGFTFTGRAFGFMRYGNFDPILNVSYSNMVFSRTSGSLTITDAPNTRPDNTAIYRLAASGILPTRIRYQLFNEAGSAVTGKVIAEATIVGDATSSTITATVRAPALAKYRVLFEIYNDTSIAASTNVFCQFGFNPANPLAAFRYGANGVGANEYIATFMLSDWGRYVQIDPHDNPAATTGPIKIPQKGITGWHTIRVPAGMNLRTSYFIQNGTPGWKQGVETLTKVKDGEFRIHITDDDPHGGRRLEFDWTRRPSNSDIRVTPDGPTGVWDERWFERGAYGAGIRTLDLGPGRANYWPRTLAPVTHAEQMQAFAAGAINMVELSQAIAEKHRRDPKFDTWMHPLNAKFDDDHVRYHFETIRDNTPPTLNKIFEFSNELWGGIAALQAQIISGLHGYAEGFGGPARADLATNPNPKFHIRYFEERVRTYAVPGDSGTELFNGIGQSPEMKAGEYMWMGLYGDGTDATLRGPHANQLFRAKRDVPRGGNVDSTNYEPIADYGQLVEAAKRWMSWRMKRYVDICKEVFGDRYAREVKWAICWQPGPVSTMDTIRFFAPGLDEEVTYLGVNAYVGDGLGQTRRQDITTGELIEAFRGNIANMIASRRIFDAEVFAAGKIPLTYEGGLHPDYYQNVTPEYKALIEREMIPPMTDPRWAGLTYDLVTASKDALFGPYFEFTTQGILWGASYDHTDNVHPKLNGVNAALRGDPRPS